MTLDRNTLLEAAKVCAEQFERDLPNQKSGGQSQDYSDGYLYGTYDCARAIRALAAAQPEGWVLVPLEPTKEMIEAGAQRLVRWETGKEKWPDAWSALDVRAARNDAERCWRSMWISAAGGKS